MNKKLLILGARGHGKIAAEIALNMQRWSEIAFLDDQFTHQKVLGVDVIGKLDEAFAFIHEYEMFVAIGDNLFREKVQNKLEALGATIPILIHQSSVIGCDVKIGDGTIIMPGAVINCCTTIGTGCIINTCSSVDHDNVIGDYVHISPGAHTAGNVHIQNKTWLCAGSTVINKISITEECVVGAGAVVVKDILESGTYIGVPAKKV